VICVRPLEGDGDLENELHSSGLGDIVELVLKYGNEVRV